jgi:enamine deaminase RidA (YjgF/YER057c/UK114 family)
VLARHHDGSPFEEAASYCRAVRCGRLVAVSGTAATDDDGTALHPGDAYAQTRTALERALAAAEHLGAPRENVVRTRIMLAPDADWRASVQAHKEAFAGIDPANTTYFVAGFIPADVLVEVELDAWATSDG